MLYLAENLRALRLEKGMTQEELAEMLHVTSQSVSKWERGETYPDITLLPALANVFETGIDSLMGMDKIRAEKTLYDIHDQAHRAMGAGAFLEAERIYREALLIYPNKPEMLLGLSEALAVKGEAREAIRYAEKGLPLSENEKQKATLRATLCFLYLQNGEREKALALASALPHTRESREVVKPKVEACPSAEELGREIRYLILGE